LKLQVAAATKSRADCEGSVSIVRRRDAFETQIRCCLPAMMRDMIQRRIQSIHLLFTGRAVKAILQIPVGLLQVVNSFFFGWPGSRRRPGRLFFLDVIIGPPLNAIRNVVYQLTKTPHRIHGLCAVIFFRHCFGNRHRVLLRIVDRVRQMFLHVDYFLQNYPGGRWTALEILLFSR
jgi:hypothetical protein